MSRGKRRWVFVGIAVVILCGVLVSLISRLTHNRGTSSSEGQSQVPAVNPGGNDPSSVAPSGSSTGSEVDADVEVDMVDMDDVLESLETGRNLSSKQVLWEIALQKELAKRRQVIESLPTYAEKEAELKSLILAANGEIQPEAIPALVTHSVELAKSFWEQGDFDAPASFDAIYEARAVLELCLATDPTNEAALRAMVEVLGSGWPFFVTRQEMEASKRENASAALKTLRVRQYEGYYALHEPLSALWEHHIKDKEKVTVDDIACAWDFAMLEPPDQAHEAFMSQYAKDHPGASEGEIEDARQAWRNERRVVVAEAMIKACERNGPSWDSYRKSFEMLKESRVAAIVVRIFFDKRGKIRYWGRLESFRGPEERISKGIEVHTIYKDRR